MDTGKTIDNFKFYKGFEDEPEIIIKAENSDMQILHIWDGYFDDMLREPNLDGNGWQGFTRDYHQCEGAFENESEAIITNINEYLADLKTYQNRHFDYDDTKEMYHLLCSWLDNAIKNGCEKISIKVI